MKTYTGGCHCGAVRFTVEADIEGGTVLSCNCSHCQIKGLLLSFVPATQFTLVSGDEYLTEYRFNKNVIEHRFCNMCGVQPFGRGKGPDGSETAAINVRCIDGIDLETLSITKYNGKDM